MHILQYQQIAIIWKWKTVSAFDNKCKHIMKDSALFSMLESMYTNLIKMWEKVVIKN